MHNESRSELNKPQTAESVMSRTVDAEAEQDTNLIGVPSELINTLSYTAFSNGEDSSDNFNKLTDRLKKYGRIALKGSQATIALAEVSPINEAVRLGVFGIGEGFVGGHDPIFGAITYGLSTLVVESLGAISAAPLLKTEISSRFTDFLNAKIPNKFKTEDKLQLTKITKVGASLLGGSVVSMAVEQLEDPDISKGNILRHGLWTSTWLTPVCAVQGAMMAEGIDLGIGHPLIGSAIGGGIILAGASEFIRRRIKNSDSRKEIQQQVAQRAYLNMIDTKTSPQRLGLGNQEFMDSLNYPGTICGEIRNKLRTHTMPILVPTTSLYWYNQGLLNKLFPESETYFYSQVAPTKSVVDKVSQKLKERDVVLASNSSALKKLVAKLNRDKALVEEGLSVSFLDNAFLNQYVGLIKFDSDDVYEIDKDIIESYREAIEDGILEENLDNGVTIVDSIDSDDAERLWHIYQKPFDDISQKSPINAGFDKDGFYKALEDTSVLKVINRKDGQITTLALFETDLSNASWLNEDYFAENYPDAYRTKNILLFLGIVSDESMRGQTYSQSLINLLLKVGKKRGSCVYITFECNEVSSRYLPQLVDFAINASEIATIDGLHKPVSQTTFSVIKLDKANNPPI